MIDEKLKHDEAFNLTAIEALKKIGGKVAVKDE